MGKEKDPGPLKNVDPWVSELGALGRSLVAEWFRRRVVASFIPGDGLKIVGNPNAQKRYQIILRREMARSPRFDALIREIDADKAHPVTVTLGWDDPDVFLDNFDSKRFVAGQQELDLADLAQLPVELPKDHPNAVTQGEILVHSMTEAREGALGAKYPSAHDLAIDAQNDYRDERGQKGHRKAPPDDGGYNKSGNWDMTYDNGHNEVWVLQRGKIQRINRMQL